MLCLVSRTHQESQVVLKTEHDKEIEKWREYKVLPSARGGRMCWAGQAGQTRPSMSNFRDLSSLTLPPPTPRASRPSQTATLSLLYIISMKIIERVLHVFQTQSIDYSITVLYHEHNFLAGFKVLSDGRSEPPQIQSF